MFADFLAYADPEVSDAQRGLIAPQAVQLVRRTALPPVRPGLVGKRDPLTFKRVYVVDPSARSCRSRFFAEGFEYKLLGLIPTRPPSARRGGRRAPRSRSSCMGTDIQGRDMWSRLMYGTRMSLTIGLVERGDEPGARRRAGRHLRLLRRHRSTR